MSVYYVRKKGWKRTYQLGIALTLIDGLFTKAVVSMGSREMNPILAAIQDQVGLDAMLFIRVVFGCVALTVLYRLSKRYERLGYALSLVVLALSILAAYHVINTILWILVQYYSL